MTKRLAAAFYTARRFVSRLAGRRTRFPGSRAYWQSRYAAGGNSGAGSYDKFAAFKAEVLNRFVAERGVASVIEFGCGDGNQLALSAYPAYLGLDVSRSALDQCETRFAQDASKRFCHLDDYTGTTAELALSLDVIFHLVEDHVYEHYMASLFAAATRYVIVYASDRDAADDKGAEHVRHRKFSAWIAQNAPDWSLLEHIPNRYPYAGDYTTGSFADFHIFARRSARRGREAGE